MKSAELAELFLTKLYELAESSDYSQHFNLRKIASEFGETDRTKVRNIAEYLKDKGLIKAFFSKDGAEATISGDGAMLVEKGGDTGIIKKYKENPESVINIDQSTTIHGNVIQSNVSTHSPGVSQQLLGNEALDEVLDKMMRTVQADPVLSKEQITDILHDINTLKLQLNKSNRNKSFITAILSTLGNISSIASFVGQVSQLI